MRYSNQLASLLNQRKLSAVPKKEREHLLASLMLKQCLSEQQTRKNAVARNLERANQKEMELEWARQLREAQKKPKSLLWPTYLPKTGLTPKDLYNIAVSFGDETTATIGELKDAYATREATAQETARKAATLDAREAGLATDLQAMGVLDAMQQVPAQIRQQANAWLTEKSRQEYEKFLSLVPEFGDDGTRIAYEKEAREMLKDDYGVVPEQLGVRSVGMHRLVRDLVNLKKTVAKLTEPRPETAPTPVKRSRSAPPRSGGADQLRKRAAETGQLADKVAAVGALLSEG